MKKIILSLGAFSVVGIMLTGCGQSKPDAAVTDQKSSPPPAAAPAAAAPTTAATTSSQTPPPASAPGTSTAPAATAASAVAASPVPQKSASATPTADASAPGPAANTAQATVPSVSAPDTTADATSQLLTAAKASGDTVLSSVSSDLTAKAKTLAQSVTGNDAVKSQLNNSLKSLAGGNDSGGLTSLYQVAQSASLTPPQVQLAKEVGNLASAYVVQKNFASLDGAQGDVATIVNSLRQGQITPAIPAIQKVAQNANLTSTQKQLVASIADRYAPGVSKAASALSQGLQSIPGLGGK